MKLEILCEPMFPAKESADLHSAASALGLTPEELIRAAVKSFVAQCVPTQNSKENTRRISFSDCVPTQR